MAAILSSDLIGQYGKPKNTQKQIKAELYPVLSKALQTDYTQYPYSPEYGQGRSYLEQLRTALRGQVYSTPGLAEGAYNRQLAGIDRDYLSGISGLTSQEIMAQRDRNQQAIMNALQLAGLIQQQKPDRQKKSFFDKLSEYGQGIGGLASGITSAAALF